jgi:hypothetical protein
MNRRALLILLLMFAARLAFNAPLFGHELPDPPAMSVPLISTNSNT